MCKKVLRALLFLMILVVMAWGLSPVFVPKDNTEDSGIHDSFAKGYLAEPENSLDVLFLGDSEGHCSFIPLQIWEDHGITSYICGGGNQILCQSYSYLEDVFQRHHPKLVILETNAMYREFTVADFLSNEMQELLPIFQYHDRWKNLQAEDFTSTPSYTNIIRDKGYAFRHTIVPRHIQFHMESEEGIEPVPVINQQYVRMMRDFCRERNVEFLLVSAPYQE